MTLKNKSDLLNYLKDVGCCRNCCLRYLSDKFLDLSDVKSFKEHHEVLEFFVKNNEVAESKKTKCNPCSVCLGLLQDASVDSILAHTDLLVVQEYDTNVFTCSISMPACVQLREHSMRLDLETRYPDVFDEGKTEIPLNRAWKMFVKEKLAKHLDKTFENSDICDFSINVVMEYNDDLQELEVLKYMQPKMFEDRKNQHRKFGGEVFSRKGVLTALSNTTSGTFKSLATIPPEIPAEAVFCKTIECKHEPMYIAGRYCKYTRELSQSPWIIDGVKSMETSVQEIIFEKLHNIFQIPEKNLVFSSSGREDCDVRCVGKGRPFYIEILDPRKTTYSFNEFRQLEQEINRSTLVQVCDLQKVNRSDLVHIKMGEEEKSKVYTAICAVQNPMSQEILDTINNYGPFVIQQKTPMRVLHRRPVAVRKKSIHHMRAELILGQTNHFTLFVKTQAGTYIKEFVHGDFRRTTPSLRDIIKTDVDILALDVTSIDLDWPKSVKLCLNE